MLTVRKKTVKSGTPGKHLKMLMHLAPTEAEGNLAILGSSEQGQLYVLKHMAQNGGGGWEETRNH